MPPNFSFILLGGRGGEHANEIFSLFFLIIHQIMIKSEDSEQMVSKFVHILDFSPYFEINWKYSIFYLINLLSN